jgi:hypothetical protein
MASRSEATRSIDAPDRYGSSPRRVPAAGDDLEIVELHPQGHRPTARALIFAVPPDPLDQGLQFGGHGVEFGEIGGECILGAD